jgi:hypothetical protein
MEATVKRNVHTDIKTDAMLNIESKHWYLDLLLVADKQFVDYNKV